MILIMELIPNYDIKDRETDIAKWFIDFEANRAEDELKSPEEQDPRLVVYHERVSHSSDSEDSLLYRHNFLKESLLATVPNLPQKDPKEMLDDMHKRKIDMADEIFVINVDGYIGSSTRYNGPRVKTTSKKIMVNRRRDQWTQAALKSSSAKVP